MSPTATIIPAEDAEQCNDPSCKEDEMLSNVQPETNANARILCPKHRVEYLREVCER